MAERMIFKKSWEEFQATGLLWFVNRSLHLFGWAIVVEVEEGTGRVTASYPARTRFRGFDPKSESEGFIQVTEYLSRESAELLKEAKE